MTSNDGSIATWTLHTLQELSIHYQAITEAVSQPKIDNNPAQQSEASLQHLGQQANQNQPRPPYRL